MIVSCNGCQGEYVLKRKTLSVFSPPLDGIVDTARDSWIAQIFMGPATIGGHFRRCSAARTVSTSSIKNGLPSVNE